MVLMNQFQKEPALDESVKEVMQTLPPVVRDYLSQGKYTVVVKDLMVKHGLRIDQGGVLEREIILLLMGIENPDEFTKALVEDARLSQQMVGAIARDVNVLIFIPLREEMRKGGAGSATLTPPKINTPSAEQKSHFNLQNKITPAPSQVQPLPVAKPSVPQDNPPQKIVSPRPVGVHERPMLAAQKPIQSNTLLEDHEEPSPVLKTQQQKIPVSVVSGPSDLGKTISSVLSRPIVVAPSQNLPGALPPQPVPVQPPPSIPKQIPAPFPVKNEPQKENIQPIVPASIAPIKSYPSDPYREPIE